jgi:hypothetical protein
MRVWLLREAEKKQATVGWMERRSDRQWKKNNFFFSKRDESSSVGHTEK